VWWLGIGELEVWGRGQKPVSVWKPVPRVDAAGEGEILVISRRVICCRPLWYKGTVPIGADEGFSIDRARHSSPRQKWLVEDQEGTQGGKRVVCTKEKAKQKVENAGVGSRCVSSSDLGRVGMNRPGTLCESDANRGGERGEEAVRRVDGGKIEGAASTLRLQHGEEICGGISHPKYIVSSGPTTRIVSSSNQVGSLPAPPPLPAPLPPAPCLSEMSSPASLPSLLPPTPLAKTSMHTSRFTPTARLHRPPQSPLEASIAEPVAESKTASQALHSTKLVCRRENKP